MSSKALSLYRSMMKSAHKIDDYNFRSYFSRKVRTEFRKQAGLSGVAANDALASAQAQLEQLNR